jgi:hypothetical protein
VEAGRPQAQGSGNAKRHQQVIEERAAAEEGGKRKTVSAGESRRCSEPRGVNPCSSGEDRERIPVSLRADEKRDEDQIPDSGEETPAGRSDREGAIDLNAVNTLRVAPRIRGESAGSGRRSGEKEDCGALKIPREAPALFTGDCR